MPVHYILCSLLLLQMLMSPLLWLYCAHILYGADIAVQFSFLVIACNCYSYVLCQFNFMSL